MGRPNRMDLGVALFHFNHAASRAGDMGAGYRRDTQGHQRVKLEKSWLLMFDALTRRPSKLSHLLVSD